MSPVWEHYLCFDIHVHLGIALHCLKVILSRIDYVLALRHSVLLLLQGFYFWKRLFVIRVICGTLTVKFHLVRLICEIIFASLLFRSVLVLELKDKARAALVVESQVLPSLVECSLDLHEFLRFFL